MTSTPAAPGDVPRTLREVAQVFLAHTSPRVLLGSLALAVVARGMLGNVSPWDLVPLTVVVVAWPLVEWLIHVFVLHQKPFQLMGRTFDLPVPRKHRAHHADPWNLEILFIPTHSFLYSLPMAAALSWLLTPSPGLALTAASGVLLMALHYEWVHLLAHTRYVPRTAHYRGLVRNHRLHHFKNEHCWYGVSMLGADRALGTAPDLETVPSSPTCRKLAA